ncbi:ABC transporter permease [Luteimicrobium xylanilyticum]|uniref:Putative D,D-dipeptide transport system permease protein DdpC n=1 Tax=Luteimicrobium xylanilyticum TaxID=1133546 RepID=A0A5P9Q6Q2_9MICO|nr:ABC transporter permease [Luteimicrobium xylanilyticum]QFU97049.1 putative D,D-dipeptide transport system permease protein DdpC [Luteimicrobium xylanilyticum]
MSNLPIDPAAAVPVDTESLVESAVEGPSTDPAHRKKKKFVFVRNAKSITGLVILAVFVVLAIIGPWIAPHNPNDVSLDLLAPPSGSHWLGTDHLGRDVFSQLLVGTRSVMIVGLVTGVGATLLAVLIGVSAGFLGGIPDEVLSALANIFLVLPALPLIIIIASQMDNAGSMVIALVLAATGWAWGARVLRAQTLSLRGRDFIEAARATGESTGRIVWFETLPNLTAIIASSFVSTVTFAVLSQTTLAFIGVTSISDWSWGTVLYWAQANQALSRGAWWWFVPAGLLVAVLGMALTLINFGIDEFVNPRLRLAGMSAREMRRSGIRPRIGFTARVRNLPRTYAHPTPVVSAGVRSSGEPVATTSDEPKETVR